MINKQDYSSYRIPYIDEFVPGFKYEYVSCSFSKFLDKPSNPLCQNVMGMKGRVLKVYRDTNEADVEFYGLYPDNISFVTKTNLGTLFSRDSKYKEWIFEPCKITTHYWKEGIHGSAWGIPKKEDIIYALSKGEIITKGKCIYHNRSTIRPYPWITVYPEDGIVYGKTVTLYSLGTNKSEVMNQISQLQEEENKKNTPLIREYFEYCNNNHWGISYRYIINPNYKHLEAMPMKREKKGKSRQKRSPERLAKKAKQSYDNYKRVRKNRKNANKPLPEVPRADGIYLYAIHTIDNKVKPFDQATKNYRKVLRKNNILLSDCSRIYRTSIIKGSNFTECVYNKKQHISDKSKRTTKQDTVHVPTKKGEKKLICLQSNINSNYLIKVEKRFVDLHTNSGDWKIVSKETYKNLTTRLVYVNNPQTGQFISLPAKKAYELNSDEWRFCSKKEYNEHMMIATKCPPHKDKGGRINKYFKHQVEERRKEWNRKKAEAQRSRNKTKIKSPTKRRAIRLNKAYQRFSFRKALHNIANALLRKRKKERANEKTNSHTKKNSTTS